jgi:hypothetical protein
MNIENFQSHYNPQPPAKPPAKPTQPTPTELVKPATKVETTSAPAKS